MPNSRLNVWFTRLALLTLFAAAAYGALDPHKAITQYVQEAWTTEQGLPQNSVFSIVQTRDGYVWVGTEDGLARFDGVRYTTFEKSNTPELGSSMFTAMFAARDGSLWVGSTGGGLIHEQDGKFQSFTMRSGLLSNVVRAVYESPDGAIWAGTDGAGLSRFWHGRFQNYSTKDGLPNNSVLAICDGGGGTLWVGTRGGLAHLENGKFTVYKRADGLPMDAIKTLYRDRDGVLWVGTDGGGMARFSGGAFKVYTTLDGLSSNVIWSLSGDDAGVLWIGTSGGGLNRFYAGAFSIYTTKEGLTSDQIWTTLQDREGGLWVGTHGGGVLRLQDGPITTISAQEGLLSDTVLPVYEDREGAIWLGTNLGVNRLKDGQITSLTKKDGLADTLVFSILQDREGSMWFATRKGINRLQNGKMSQFTTSDGLPNNWTTATYLDRDGTIWAGTRGGLARFDGKRFQAFTSRNGLTNDFVQCIYQDVKGVYWIGTMGGISRFQSGHFSSYTTRNGLVNDVIWSIAGDPDGTLWITTNGGGLQRWHEGRFTSYTRREGLYDDVVESTLSDHDGNLWMSSNRGIFRVSRADLDGFANGRVKQIRSISYGTSDGMKSKECNGGFQPAGWPLRDGRLLFPTMHGVSIVDPKSLNTQPLPSKSFLEKLVVNDSIVDFHSPVKQLAGEGQLQIEFTSLSFSQPEKISFRYMLEGLDESWVEAGSRRTAYYTNLAPGKYRFRVVACNRDGACDNDEASVSLTLTPHWYQTRIFSALCLLTSGGSFFVAYRRRMRRLRLTEARLVETVNERTAALAHHAKALEESEKRFRQFAENIREVFWMVNPNTGELVYVSPAYREIWLDEPDSVLRNKALWLHTVHPEDRQRVVAAKQDQNAGRNVETEYRVLRADGSMRWVWDRSFPVFDAQGQLDRIVGIVEDITEDKESEEILRRSRDELQDRVLDLKAENLERQRAEEQLKIAKEAAEAANHSKSEFLANISHEIRTPLNGIIGMMQLALHTELSREQREYLQLVESSADSLLSIINDVLDFSKIEARKLHLESIEFDLRSSLDRALKSLSVRAHQKGLELISKIESDVPELLVGDPVRLTQVIVNLIGNAVKFTDRGEIVVAIRRVKTDKRDCCLEFTVTDTGIGIARDKQRSIFEAFTQADGSSTRKYGGTGLGLSISSQLVTMMRGKLWVESEPGCGSTFGFTACFASAPQKAEQPAAVNLRGHRILIVDDNVTLLATLEDLLTGWGAQVTTSNQAVAAMAKVRQALATGQPYSLVLVDAEMPEMSGLALAQQMRTEAEFTGAIVMLLTSAGDLTDAASWRALGIEERVIKPIYAPELQEAVVRSLWGTAKPRETVSRTEVAFPQKNLRRQLNILLVEDTPVNQMLARRLLEKSGHSVTTANNGRLALELLELRNGDFDLVLMDVQMPEMDGYQATAAIRKREKHWGIRLPIIAMTAHALERDQERCLAAGMDAYLSKPIDIEKLFQLIDKVAPEQAVLR